MSKRGENPRLKEEIAKQVGEIRKKYPEHIKTFTTEEIKAKFDLE